MGFQIEDGTGKGYLASVNSDNKLKVTAVVATQEHYANHNQGKAYSAIFESTPVSGGCFMYVKNIDPELDLSIEGFWLKMAADDYVEIKLDDSGSPSSGINVSPVNLNTGSGYAAQGTFQKGSNIGGLSGGNIIYKMYHANTTESIYRNFNQDVILAQNGVLTMYIGTGSTPISAILVFNFHGTHN